CARFRPSSCDWLNERSLNLPMSLTRAAVKLEPPPVVEVDDVFLPLEPPQPASRAATATIRTIRSAILILGTRSSKTKGGPVGPPFRFSIRRTLELGRDLQLALDDPRLDLVHRGDEPLRHGRVDPADAHAVVGERELQVAVALELAGLRRLDHVEDAEVNVLDAARQHTLGVLVLVLVDPDAPDVMLGRSGQRAETAAAGDLEQNLRALRDLVLGHRLAEVRLDEVAGVAHEHLDVLVVELRAELVAGDPDVHRRNVQPADGPDHLLAALLLDHLGRQVADEAARLVGRV